MLQTSEDESEILLGNKQLLGIFLVVAVLLGVAFTGGFLIGRGGTAKRAAAVEAASGTNPESSAKQTSAGGQTHTLEGDTALPAAASGGADSEAAVPGVKARTAGAEESTKRSETALGARRRAASSAGTVTPAKTSKPEPETRAADSESDYVPRSGTQYLQVAAVGRDEAEAVSDVLRKRGFHAHAVPKPGNEKLYRVIIGPVKDAGDLSSTRDALRKTFREVIVQRY